MIIGSTPPFFTRSISSLASSMMVRSAAKSVSNTLVKAQAAQRASHLAGDRGAHGDAELFAQRRAHGRGRLHTPHAWWDRPGAANTLAVSSCSVSAPVGHTAMHWPQLMQAVSASESPQAQAICVLKPRLIGPITPTCCTLLHTATQRRQRMHLALLRTMEGDLSSICVSVRLPRSGFRPRRRTRCTASATRRWWNARRTGTFYRGWKAKVPGSSCGRCARRGCWS